MDFYTIVKVVVWKEEDRKNNDGHFYGWFSSSLTILSTIEKICHFIFIGLQEGT